MLNGPDHSIVTVDAGRDCVSCSLRWTFLVMVARRSGRADTPFCYCIFIAGRSRLQSLSLSSTSRFGGTRGANAREYVSSSSGFSPYADGSLLCKNHLT